MKAFFLFAATAFLLFSCQPSDSNCIEGDCKNGQGVEDLSELERYEGEFKNGKRHGKGSLYNEIFDITYDAHWKDGKLHGKGTEEHGPESATPGARFKGRWVNGKKSGQGSFRYGSEDEDFPDEEYIGEFTNGMMTGKGRYTWPDGSWDEGDFVNEMLHGKGTRFLAYDEEEDTEPQTYVGEFQINLQHGFGKLTWEDGESYEGEWEEGVYHGHGIYTLSNGAVYEGDWVDGQSDGFDAWFDRQ